MTSATSFDAIEPRTVFKAYAFIAWSVGILLVGWGPMWFRIDLVGLPFAWGMMIRVFGAIVLAAACTATAFSEVEASAGNRRALGWFAVGHVIVLAVVAIQIEAVVGDLRWEAELTLGVLAAAAILLSYLWMTASGLPLDGLGQGAGQMTSLFRNPSQPSASHLRSAYEEQIRAAAGLEERNRIARDLHDSIKQQIFVIQTAAATALARFDADRAGAREALEQVGASSQEAMTEMQAMLDQMRAAPLENTGLVEVLKRQCEALGFRTGAEVRFAVDSLPPNDRVPPGAQQTVFRVAQEALTNVARHSRAKHVTVALGADGDNLQLRVEDDGRGFEPERVRGGMGLGNMRARAEPLGGTVAVVSRPGEGTRLLLSIPCTVAPLDDLWYYKRRATWAIAGALFWMFLTGLRVTAESSRFFLILYMPMALVFTLTAARATLAYLRMREGVAR